MYQRSLYSPVWYSPVWLGEKIPKDVEDYSASCGDSFSFQCFDVYSNVIIGQWKEQKYREQRTKDSSTSVCTAVMHLL